VQLQSGRSKKKALELKDFHQVKKPAGMMKITFGEMFIEYIAKNINDYCLKQIGTKASIKGYCNW